MNWSIAQTEVMMSMETEQVSIDLGKLKRLQNEAIQKVILICGGMHKGILLQYSCMLVCLKMKVGSLLYNLTKWACTCPPISWIPTYLDLCIEGSRQVGPRIVDILSSFLFFFFPLHIFSSIQYLLFYRKKKKKKIYTVSPVV